jgi:hypothetical protein
MNDVVRLVATPIKALPVFLRLSPSARPPALGPRRRLIEPSVERALRGWVHEALRSTRAPLVGISEWVSLDSRAVPHTVSFIVDTGGARRHLVIEKASERIVRSDVNAVLASQGLCAQERRATAEG